MRLLLETDHYVDDQLLEKGMEVGDGPNAVHDWRRKKDYKNFKAGQHLPPSVSMLPLDEEGRKLMKDHYGDNIPDRDPTASIPIQGTTDAPGLKDAKAPPLMKKV